MPHDPDRAVLTARLRLFRSQLMLRGKSIADVARAVGVTGGHLRLVVLGTRTASVRLVEALHGVLGDDVLAFVDVAPVREPVLLPRAVDVDVARTETRSK